MKKRLGLLILIAGSLVFGLLFCHSNAQSQKRGPRVAGTISEQKLLSSTVTAAPAECAQLVRTFIAYLSHQKPDIASDTRAQNRWLSKNLKDALDHRLAVFKEFDKQNPDSPDGPPGNGDFIGAWSYPTAFGIASSRRYGKQVIIDVVFSWGPKTDYPGDKRLVSFILVREGDSWKIADLYTFDGEFVRASSLSQTFFSNTYP